MEQTRQEEAHRGKRLPILGEWSWEKHIALLAGILCLVDAILEQKLAIRSIVRDGAFHSALLLFLLFYVSEMRYKLFPEVRNN